MFWWFANTFIQLNAGSNYSTLGVDVWPDENTLWEATNMFDPWIIPNKARKYLCSIQIKTVLNNNAGWGTAAILLDRIPLNWRWSEKFYKFLTSVSTEIWFCCQGEGEAELLNRLGTLGQTATHYFQNLSSDLYDEKLSLILSQWVATNYYILL